MAEVTGPISTLPGASHSVPEGTMCDEHPDRPAVARLQGETDSFGAELFDCCNECAKLFREEMRRPYIGRCEWCDAAEVELRNTRDCEEGLSGRVYRVCVPCKKRYDDRVAAELDAYSDWDD